MKKLSVVAFALAMLSAAASSSWAAFTSISKQAITATVTTVGSSTVTIRLRIKDTVAPQGPDRAQVTWTNVDPGALGAQPWRIADQMVVATTSITDLTGAIQLVTDNTNPNANPRFVDPSVDLSSNTDSNPAGLVLVPPTGSTSSLTLPLSWSIKESTKVVEGTDPATGIGAADPNTGPEGEVANNRFQWFYVVDKKSPAIDLNGSGVLGNGRADDPDKNQFGLDSVAFVDGQEYSRIVDARGIHFAPAKADGSPGFGGGPGIKSVYVYFQGKFDTALPGNTYRTNQLTFEAFTE